MSSPAPAPIAVKSELSANRENRLEGAFAAVLGAAAGGIALHDVELAKAGILAGTVGELANKADKCLLGIHYLLDGLAGLLTGDRGLHCLLDKAGRNVGMLLEVVLEALVGGALHKAADLGIVQLGLRLALEEGVLDLDGDNHRKTLADILAGDSNLLPVLLGGGFLRALHVLLAGLLRGILGHLLLVVVDGHGQGGQETHQVGAAVLGVDSVDEGVDRLVVGVVVLHGDVIEEIACPVAAEIPGLALEGDDILVEDILALVEICDEFGDAALVVEGLASGGAAPDIGQGNLDAGVQICKLAEALRKNLPTILQNAKYLWVRKILNSRAALVTQADLHKGLHGLPAGELHPVLVAVAADGQIKPCRKRIDA